MPFDGSGTYTRPISSWVADATAGIKIRADRHDLQDDDFTNALTLTITRDGQTQPTNNIPLNGHRLINLGDPVNDGDAVSKGWLARTPYQVAGSDVLGRIKFQGTEADAPAGKPLGFEWAQSDMTKNQTLVTESLRTTFASFTVASNEAARDLSYTVGGAVNVSGPTACVLALAAAASTKKVVWDTFERTNAALNASATPTGFTSAGNWVWDSRTPTIDIVSGRLTNNNTNGPGTM